MSVDITVSIWQKVNEALSANIYLFNVRIATLDWVWKLFKLNEKDL